MSLESGMHLGPYQVGRKLGAGGMGEVYLARDTRLERSVAIKVLPKHLSDRPELRERFEREAKLISSLNHPHICTVYDVGCQDGIDFLVMEYLEGETLAARLEKGALPLAEALDLAVQIADALDKAHRQGVVHRDTKPGNVMLTASGAKLLDFGLAKQARPAATSLGQSDLPTGNAPLTLEGAILGTLQYMAPEQLEGKEADSRTDIFAFGSTLHEMITGRKAFEGKSQVSLIAAIVDHDPPPVSSLKPMSPPLLDHLVKTCVSKNPDKRWQTMADVLIQLQLIIDSGGELSSPELSGRMKRRLRLAWGAAAALLIAGLGLVGAFVLSRNTAAPARISFDIPTVSAPAPLHIALSPTGSHVAAITTSVDKGQVLWIRAMDQLNGMTVPGTEDAGFPFWSPDGRFIAFFAEGKLKKVDIFGAPPLTLCDAAAGHGGAWNGDGVIVFAPISDGPLFRVPAAGGPPAALTELDQSLQETAHRHPNFLPDGNHFLYLAISGKAENSGIYVASLDSKDRKFLVSTGLKAVFAPPNHLLFTRDGTLLAQQFDTKRLELVGEPFPIAEGVGINTGNSAAGFTVSDNGILAYRGGGDRVNTVLTWFDRSGKNVETIGPAPYDSPALSPDLKYIAVGRNDSAGGDIWILDLLRGPVTRFTFDPGRDGAPVWSPDGSRIVFQSNRGGTADLYQKASSGVGREELLLKSDHAKTPDDWSLDGKFLLYRDRDPKTQSDLWVLPMTGEKKPAPVVLSPFADLQGRFSPDGRWIAYVSNESGREQVYVLGFPAATSRFQISTTGGYQPRWRRDGKELFFIAEGAPRTVMAVDITVSGDGALKAGIPKALFAVNPFNVLGNRNTLEVSPDGQRFLVHAPQEQTGTSVPPITVVVNWLTRGRGAQ